MLNWRGWTKGALEEGPSGPVCSVGAVIISVAGPDGVAAWANDSDRLTDDEYALIDAAVRFLNEATDLYWGSYLDLEIWNDVNDRTFDEVLAVVRKARALAGGEATDLHDLHPQPGEPASAPLPAGVEGFPVGRAS